MRALYSLTCNVPDWPDGMSRKPTANPGVPGGVFTLSPSVRPWLDSVEDFFGEVERHCGELFHFADYRAKLVWSENPIINNMESHLTATEAARNFSDFVNRVLDRGEVFVIERRGQPVCRIVPAKPAKFTLRDLAQLWKTIPKPDPGYWDAVDGVQLNQAPLPKSPGE